jgi:zinc/manganese transport system substrate-binding protein
MHSPRLRFLICVLGSVAFSTQMFAACGGNGSTFGASSGRLRVVAAEDFWGSIARALGGERVEVSSIITNPSADPHEYEPTSADARTMASSQIAIINGIGYDQWASKLLAADPDSERITLNVGEMLGLGAGENPHQWYSPGSVGRVIDQISAAYQRSEPAHSSYFQRRRMHFERSALRRYHSLIKEIRSRYGGVPVGASESVVSPLAKALGLRLITPPGFLEAIAEGSEPSAAQKSITDRQIAERQIRVWIYNSQNATPDVQRLNEAARASGIPIATVSETLTPEGVSFGTWMSGQLEGLRAALQRAAPR